MRHILLLSLIGACGGATDSTTIKNTHDPCDGVTVGAPDGDAVQLAGIDGAIALWATQGVTLARVAANPTIEVQFKDAAGSFFGVYDDERGIVLINRSVTDPTALAIVIAHELGHTFGLVHVTDRDSLMNPGNLVVPPTVEDRHALEAMWGSCGQVPN